MAKPPPPPSRSRSSDASKSNRKGDAPSSGAILHNLKAPQAGDLKPLNFKVDPDFHREFKTYAASQGITMLELLKEGFALVKQTRG